MKKLIILLMLVLTTSLFAKGYVAKSPATLYKELSKLDKGQQELLAKSYLYGEPYALGNTLGAIAWRESNLGKIVANPREGKYGTYGPYQATLQDALVRNHLKENKANVKMLKDRLLNDLEFAANDAIAELQNWDKHHRKNKKPNLWRANLAAYNIGTIGIKSNTGRAYAADIATRVKVVEGYFKKNPHILAAYKEKQGTTSRLTAMLNKLPSIETIALATTDVVGNLNSSINTLGTIITNNQYELFVIRDELPTFIHYV